MNNMLKAFLAGAFILLVALLLLGRCNRPESGTDFDEQDLGSGPIQLTLRWDFPGDVDLHAIQPDGQEIYFANTRASGRSGGELDHDDLDGGQGAVENIYWSNPVEGAYQVRAVYYRVNGMAPDGGTVNVRVKVNGVERVYSFTLSTEGQVYDVVTVNYPEVPAPQN